MKKILVCFLLSLPVLASAQSIRQTRSVGGGGGGGGGSCVVSTTTMTGDCTTGISVNLSYGFLDGLGTTGYIPRWDGTQSLDNSIMEQTTPSTITVYGNLEAVDVSANGLYGYTANAFIMNAGDINVGNDIVVGSTVSAINGSFSIVKAAGLVSGNSGGFDILDSTTAYIATGNITNVFASTADVTYTLTAGAVNSPNVQVNALKVQSLSGMIVMTQNATCPTGWAEFTNARGFYIVGVPAGGTVGGTIGTAMTNLSDAVHNHTTAFAALGVTTGTDANVDLYSGPTKTTSDVARGSIAPYKQMRFCIIP